MVGLTGRKWDNFSYGVSSMQIELANLALFVKNRMNQSLFCTEKERICLFPISQKVGKRQTIFSVAGWKQMVKSRVHYNKTR